jgi:hypothetical protein
MAALGTCVIWEGHGDPSIRFFENMRRHQKREPGISPNAALSKPQVQVIFNAFFVTAMENPVLDDIFKECPRYWIILF